ncbi:MAG: 50S ribosomal protein L10, partial [Candidatus Komeilibacteria bacterium]|nr:50S ribosomal protein L10 [Candidatus Komeilibacteria bacterium]
MSKTRKQKEEALKDVKSDVKEAKAMVFAGYHGLSVPEIEKLRKNLRAEQVSFRVIKKTLLQRAFTDNKIDVEAKNLGLGLAVAFGMSDEVAPAKILAKFQKEHDALKIYAAYWNKNSLMPPVSCLWQNYQANLSFTL